MSCVIRVANEEVLGIKFTCCVLVQLLTVGSDGIDAYLVRIFNDFLAIGDRTSAAFLRAGGAAEAATC